MSCKTYDPCLNGKLNQIGSYASVARQSAEASSASATQSAASATSAAESAAEAAASAEIAGVYLGAFAVAPVPPIEEGALYFNTVSNQLFVWNGTSWSAVQTDDIYLGGFAVAPTLNNQGLPLVAGNLYWNTASNNLWAWNGSAWVQADFDEFTPFLATGTTTPRNLVTRMADPVNVKDFGAIGNNIADDTAAIQAAIDYAFSIHSSIYFPSGNFRTLSGIVLKCGCTCNTRAVITAGASINTVTIPTGNYTSTSAFYLPQIVGGANGLVLDGVAFATIHISNIAFAANGLVLQISDTNKVCADNNINFNTINGCSGAGIKFNHLATTISTLFQGNIIKGNFIVGVKYGIHFYDVNNGSLGLNLTWDDTLIEVGAIDPATTGSIGIYGEPFLPPSRFIVKCETFFDGCDVAYIKGGGNSGTYRLAFSSQLQYSKNQLGGIGNQIFNVEGGWASAAMTSGIFPAIPLNTTINSRSTFNGGNSLNLNRTWLKFTVPVGGWTTGTSQTLFCYHALTTNYNPAVRVEPFWSAPMYIQYAAENSTVGIGGPGGESPEPNQIVLRILTTGSVPAGDYLLALTLHNTP